MRIEDLFESYEISLKNMKTNLKSLENDYKIIKENTLKFLQECQNVGIGTVSIGVKTDKIKSCEGWDKYFAKNCIFADEELNGWPAIWKVASMENNKYSGGCGNSGQHQFNCAEFIEGVYQFKEGKWYRIDSEENK